MDWLEGGGGWVGLLAVGRDRLEIRGTCWPLANPGGRRRRGWVLGRAGWMGWRE